MGRSDWPRANVIAPTAVRKVLFNNSGILWQTLGHQISGNLLIICGGSQIWILLSSPGVFNEFETRQQKIFWRKLESPAGKCTRTKPKVCVKICLIRRFRELWIIIKWCINVQCIITAFVGTLQVFKIFVSKVQEFENFEFSATMLSHLDPAP